MCNPFPLQFLYRYHFVLSSPKIIHHKIIPIWLKLAFKIWHTKNIRDKGDFAGLPSQKLFHLPFFWNALPFDELLRPDHDYWVCYDDNQQCLEVIWINILRLYYQCFQCFIHVSIIFLNFHDVVHILSLILSYTLNEKLLNLTLFTRISTVKRGSAKNNFTRLSSRKIKVDDFEKGCNYPTSELKWKFRERESQNDKKVLCGP